MSQKKHTKISIEEPKEKTSPRFEDFFRPSPFERPWMLRYLPSNSRARDIVIVIVGNIVSLLVFCLLTTIGVNEFITAGICLTSAAIFQGESLGRTMIASANYRRAKRIGLTD